MKAWHRRQPPLTFTAIPYDRIQAFYLVAFFLIIVVVDDDDNGGGHSDISMTDRHSHLTLSHTHICLKD